MPLLNPGIVVSSPYLSDDIQIISRAQTVDDNGIVTTMPSARLSYAIVTVAGPNDLERLPEAARAKRIMSFITNDQVLPIAQDNQPDIIAWPQFSTTPPGNYVVLDVGAYPNYGEGWYQILAASQDMVDVPL
jgi:hypothetical protein